MAVVLPRLEYVLEDEIRVKTADAAVERVERGKVYFASGLPADAFMSLRTADNLYRFLHRCPVGPHRVHLSRLRKELAGLELASERSGLPGRAWFTVNASRIGNQTYSRFEAAEAAMRGNAERHPSYIRGTAEAHDTEFRLDIFHDEAVFGLRLTDAAFRRVVKRKGSILCLTEEGALLERAADRHSLSCTEEAALSLKGLHPKLFWLRR